MTAPRFSLEQLEAEGGTLLPAKEVVSLLDINIDVDLALALAAPIDLAIAANANVAAPINAAVSANVLSFLSSSAAVANQGVLIDQYISGEAIATAEQDAVIHQPGTGGADTDSSAVAAQPLTETTEEPLEPVTNGSETTEPTEEPLEPVTEAIQEEPLEPVADEEPLQPLADTLEEPLEPVTEVTDDVLDPVTGAIDGAPDRGRRNKPAHLPPPPPQPPPHPPPRGQEPHQPPPKPTSPPPSPAAVAANIGSIGSEAIAIADQTAIITQRLDGVVAEATVEQDAEITQ
jgi:hypothetical protein